MGLKMNKFWMLAVVAIIIIVGIFSFKAITGNVTSENVQKITLSFKNYNYYPNTISVEAGKPVEITLDNSIRGCFRSFNIRDLGVSYSSSSPSDVIKFTPTKKGAFQFTCSMRMGYGTINVV
jgi:plastocyanin domain-containing protein